MHGTDDQRPHDAQQDPGRDRVADVREGDDSDGDTGGARADELGDDEDDDEDDPDPTDPSPEEVAELDPMAPGTWMFEDADGEDAVEPNEPA